MPHTLQKILLIGPPVTLWIFIALLAGRSVQPVARACVAAMGPLLAAVALCCGASAGAAAMSAALATVAACGSWHNRQRVRLRALSAALAMDVPKTDDQEAPAVSAEASSTPEPDPDAYAAGLDAVESSPVGQDPADVVTVEFVIVIRAGLRAWAAMAGIEPDRDVVGADITTHYRRCFLIPDLLISEADLEVSTRTVG